MTHLISCRYSHQQRTQEDYRPTGILTQGQVPAEYTNQVQNGVLSRSRAVLLITTLTGVTFIGSMSSGLLTICLPGIAADLELPDNLLLW